MKNFYLLLPCHSDGAKQLRNFLPVSLRITFISVLILTLLSACRTVPPPAASFPIPSARQMAWQELEYYAFVHFNMNTFTDMEWGTGGEKPEMFNPTALDCRQWARVCKDAGMKGIIITAKHHDGFCLWPSAYTEHSVKNSPWRGGKGDVIRELSDACREYGLKFGVYLSPWDRNHADYGRPEYIPYFRNQLRELLTNYGKVFEVWFDGANGGTGWYGGANERRVIDAKTYYDWENTYKIIRELQPDAVIFSDASDIRWVGNEEGWARPTNWSMINREAYLMSEKRDLEILRSGQEDGADWAPAEVDVSIRPGWYYHASEDHKVKTLPKLLEIYYASVGRNGSLLLNLPVDNRGLVHENDVEALMKLAASLKKDFANDLAAGKKAEASNVRGGSPKYDTGNTVDGNERTYWTTDDSVKKASLTIDFGKQISFNRFLAREYIALGQRVKKFSLEALNEGTWKTIANETTVGNKRILRLPQTEASAIRFNILEAKASPVISTLQVFNAPVVLEPPQIIRDQSGKVTVRAFDENAEIRFTTDGSEPGIASARYDSAFPFLQKGIIKVVVLDPQSGEKSPVITRSFDIPKMKWQIRGDLSGNARASSILDGSAQTAISLPVTLPYDFVFDLGESVNLKGFTYLPDQGRWNPGIARTYEFYVSRDGKNWARPVASGEFGNIRNNPVQQEVRFAVTQALYVKFRVLSDASGENRVGMAEFDVITE